jgi:signal transduction histidine kinase
MVEVSVQDAGPGVAPEEREHIFARFAQVEAGGIRPRGFGLGLSYCKLAVEAHNGRIWVEPGPTAWAAGLCLPCLWSFKEL